MLLLAALVSCVLLPWQQVAGDSTGIGQGFYLPKLSLIADNGFGKSVFKDIPKECIRAVPSDLNREEKSYFENTQSFYSKLGIESSLSGEVTDGFTLAASIESASNSIASKTLEVKGMSYDVYAMTGFWDFIPDCMTTVDLTDEIKHAFENLPSKISSPHLASSWFEYDTFINTFGSHVTRRISHGSKLTRYVFSKSSEKINSDTFLIKVCSTLKDVNLTYCSNFTAADYARVASLATSEELTVRGGSAETRAQLMNNVDNALVEKFLTEANLTDQPISVQYTSVWDVLKSRYLGTEHFVKASIMEAYYLGYLNTGCSYQKSDGQELRKFVLVDDHASVPSFECRLAPMGCRSDNDCHIGGMGSVCYAYGPSCVDKLDTHDPRHTLKETRHVKKEWDGTSTWEGVNWSCYYHVGVYCLCDKSWGGDWETVWPREQYKAKLRYYQNVQARLRGE